MNEAGLWCMNDDWISVANYLFESHGLSTNIAVAVMQPAHKKLHYFGFGDMANG
jgi:hypothetical protein